MKRQWRGCAGVFAVMLAGGAMMLPAQIGKQAMRGVSGTVTDGHREPLKGAVVQVQNEGTNAVLTYVTGGDGHYEFKRLDAGTDYTVWAKYRSGESKKHFLSKFDSKAEKSLDLAVSLP
jgi:hypothetical protein